MKIALVAVALIVAFLVWRSRASTVTALIDDSGATGQSPVVGLGINELPTNVPGERLFELVYDRGAGTSQLRFSYLPKPVQADAPATFTRASFHRQPPSQAEPLLAALARAHAASRTRGTVQPLDRLDCEAALFGDRLSTGKGGNVIAGLFTDEPVGTWIVFKLFIPRSTPDSVQEEAEEPAELFLGLDPTTHQGLFLAKDPEYWPALERELARVL